MRIKQSGKIDPVEIEAAMPYQDDAPTPEEGDEFLALNFCSPGGMGAIKKQLLIGSEVLMVLSSALTIPNQY